MDPFKLQAWATKKSASLSTKEKTKKEKYEQEVDAAKQLIGSQWIGSS